MSESELQQLEADQADRSIFVRELLMNALVEGLSLDFVNSCSTKSSQNSNEGESIFSQPSRDTEPPVASGNVLPQMQVATRVQGTTTASKKSQSVSSSHTYSRNGNALAQVRDQSNAVGSGSRGASSTQSQRVAPSGTGTVREVPVPQGVVPGRIPLRSSTSPSSSTRRKMVRHLDGRNQPNEPPQPH